jgi:hypothetical protein
MFPGKRGTYATFEDGQREMIFCEKVVENAKENRWVRI